MSEQRTQIVTLKIVKIQARTKIHKLKYENLISKSSRKHKNFKLTYTNQTKVIIGNNNCQSEIYILILVIPCSTRDSQLTTKETATLFFNYVFCQFVSLYIILYNHDPHFTSHFWIHFWQIYGT